MNATATAPVATERHLTILKAAKMHWPEYVSEAAGLGIFMVSACLFTVVLEHPGSPANSLIPSAFVRRLLMGLAMGLTALGIVTSSLGQRSGAHLNPAMTLNFYLLGKIRGSDAIWYAAAQFAGGALGIAIAEFLIGSPIRTVRYAVTVPGAYGDAVAFVAEFAISFLLMLAVLITSNSRRLTKLTPYIAGTLVAAWITFEAPFSGMSMNPARTAASAIGAGIWTSWWIYATAPVLGMATAGFLHQSRRSVFCAKLHHHNDKRCIFRCNYEAL